MEFLIEYGLFLAKAITIVIAIGIVIGLIAGAGAKSRQSGQSGRIEVTNLSEALDNLEDGLQKELLNKAEYKNFAKEKKAENKKSKTSAEQGVAKPKCFIVEFDGDIKASAVENLREEVTAILKVAKPSDSVLVKLESPGGMVHTYGLASSQLDRIKSNGLSLTIAVDAVAASGGYMMACVADKIVAAPFAIIGSIGVVGQLPNFNRLLKQNHIDFEQHTAGEYKRTLTLLGENTDKGREKFREELEQTHQLFKNFIAQHRPDLNLEKVATGEHWYGIEAQTLGLVDQITTSDDLILEISKTAKVYKVKYEVKKPLSERIPMTVFARLQDQLINFIHRMDIHKMFR